MHAFRVTRNADLEVEEDRDEDLLQSLERELARRRFGPPVRLEVTDTMSEHVLELLLRELDVDPHDVVTVPGLLDLTALWAVHGVDRPDLKDDPFVPATHPAFADRETPRSVFATLREGDVLVHHPYDSFSTSVQRFIEQAAADPNVLAIKQTLYRTSGDSPIVDALIDAAAAGKQVVALVEIKARFDEQANIRWARELEKAGVHVVYGLVGLKTHCKTSLVVRQEGSTIRRYCHIGTGNYNPKTARLYEDLGVLTADPTIGADLTDLFNSLTGYSRQTSYRSLLVAPYGVRRGIVRRIEDEIDAHRAGNPEARIRIKVNSLVDEQVIDALYRASQAGVPVDVVVRGICALRPGRPGLSENIHVRSILGRFLEHSRVFHFAAADEYWIGSADMMHRNLDRRVEVLLRVAEPRLAEQAGRDVRLVPRPGHPLLDAARRRVVGAVAATGLRGVAGARPPGRDDAAARRRRRRHGVGVSGIHSHTVEPTAVDVLAAGAVLWRRGGDGVELALVHRPRYDDWSFPKGKLDAGESLPFAAVREVAEETGQRGPARRGRSATCATRWPRAASSCGTGPPRPAPATFAPNEETDELRWLDAARRRRAAVLPARPRGPGAVRRRSARRRRWSLLVRHAKAGSRDQWDGDDDLRPLSGAGREQARQLARAAAAVRAGPRRHRRPAALPRHGRCRSPQDLGLDLLEEPLLGEEEFWADPVAGLARLRELAARAGVTVVCSQGGVIPDMVGTLTDRSAPSRRRPRRPARPQGEHVGADVRRERPGPVGRLLRAPHRLTPIGRTARASGHFLALALPFPDFADFSPDFAALSAFAARLAGFASFAAKEVPDFAFAALRAGGTSAASTAVATGAAAARERDGAERGTGAPPDGRAEPAHRVGTPAPWWPGRPPTHRCAGCGRRGPHGRVPRTPRSR